MTYDSTMVIAVLEQKRDYRTPSVSLGLLVYNGETFLREAIESILAQTYTDFELIISDNASTDGTAPICKDYQARDLRIGYHRNEKNIGAAGNFNRVFSLARGKYFKWVAHDDVYDKKYLAKCVQILDRHQSVVLCSTDLAIIDEHGNIVKENVDKINTDAETTHERFRALLSNHHCYEMVSGLMRSEAAKLGPPVGSYGHSDGIFLTRLGLLGRFHQIPGRLFYYREHSNASHKVNTTFRDYVVFFDPTKSDKILLPRWRMGFEYLRSISLFPLSIRERLLCFLHMGRWLRESWKGLAANIVFALFQLMCRPF